MGAFVAFAKAIKMKVELANSNVAVTVRLKKGSVKATVVMEAKDGGVIDEKALENLPKDDDLVQAVAAVPNMEKFAEEGQTISVTSVKGTTYKKGEKNGKVEEIKAPPKEETSTKQPK